MTRAGRNPDELAHDVNNLLTAVIGAADAILARAHLDPETRADIEAIREGARRGGGLARSGNRTSIEPIPVNAAIRQTARLLARRLGPEIALILDLAPGDWPIEMDPSQLDSMLLNLTANARHAMPEGGTVTLRTRHCAVIGTETRLPDRIPPGDYVLISVADTGPGIQDGQIPRVFEPGFTTRPAGGGTGLGLPSVLGVVRQARGYLAIKSGTSGGATFEIFLPRSTGQAAAETPLYPGAGASAGTILLVEDDPMVRGVAVQAARRGGWNVVAADGAEEALAALDQPGFVCDLVITDVSMPGMDGLALAQLVRARRPGMPVILTSGYDIPPPDDAGVTFLIKPYGQEQLLDAAARAVNEARRRRPSVGTAPEAVGRQMPVDALTRRPFRTRS